MPQPIEQLLSVDTMMQVHAGYWAAKSGIRVDGNLINLADHRYQIDMLACDHPNQSFRKGAQIGLTTLQMLKTIHGHLNQRYPQGTLYLFPSRDDVTDFSKGRFAPLITDNPVIQQAVSDTDAANIKRVGGAMLYFRGTRSRSQLKSVPVDRLVFDEIDEMQPRMVDLAMERISHSSVREIVKISTPTLPDYGIDVAHQESDQRVWQIKCRHCGRHTCLELEFAEREREQRVLVRRPDGTVIRACTHCGGEIYPRDGHWVAQFPERSRDAVGWWISQLNSKFVAPEAILQAYQDPRCNLTEFYNSKLGMPYVEAKDRLTIEQVLSLCSDYGITTHDAGPCSMGVDQGKDLHVVVGKRDGRGSKIVLLEVLKEWEQLDNVVKLHHVSRAVVDALPETRNAREFSKRFPGKIYLNYYQDHQRGGYKWDDREMTVACNRTESLDSSHKELLDGLVGLPRKSDTVEEFAKHCHNVAKRLEEDDETGSRRYVYVKLGPDHFRHAFNYETMARQFGANGFFGGLDLS